jgi:hypothetical protein
MGRGFFSKSAPKLTLEEERKIEELRKSDPDVQFVENISGKVDAIKGTGTIVIDDPEKLKTLFTTYRVDPGYLVQRLLTEKAKEGITIQSYRNETRDMITVLMRLQEAIWNSKKGGRRRKSKRYTRRR